MWKKLKFKVFRSYSAGHRFCVKTLSDHQKMLFKKSFPLVIYISRGLAPVPVHIWLLYLILYENKWEFEGLLTSATNLTVCVKVPNSRAVKEVGRWVALPVTLSRADSTCSKSDEASLWEISRVTQFTGWFSEFTLIRYYKYVLLVWRL